MLYSDDVATLDNCYTAEKTAESIFCRKWYIYALTPTFLSKT